MGYVRQRKLYKLLFEDPDLAGLEVTTRSSSVDAYQRIAQLSNRRVTNRPSAEDLAEIEHLFEAFTAVLEGWNLEEPAGVPVPATLEGLKSQELPFVMMIILAWMDTVAGVTAPLGTPSRDGGQSLEESMPMEPLSSSL
jgi:hypothetical protein